MGKKRFLKAGNREVGEYIDHCWKKGRNFDEIIGLVCENYDMHPEDGIRIVWDHGYPDESTYL